jgi:hypothetical protein
LRCPQYVLSGKSYRSKKDVHADFKGNLGFDGTEDDVIEWLKLNKSQADIHIQAIAELMWDAMNKSEPKELKAGEWHIPFGDNIDYEKLGQVTSEYYRNNPNEIIDVDKWLIKIAIARCARISYQTLGDDPKIDYEADIKLFDILSTSGHWSPFEHVARCMSENEYACFINGKIQGYNPMGYAGIQEKVKGWCRNFRGFIQYRSLMD